MEINRHMSAGGSQVSNVWKGSLTVEKSEWHKMYREFTSDGLIGWNIHTVEDNGDTVRVLYAPKKNLVVDSGVQNGLDRVYGLGGAPLITMGVDDGASNPNSSTSSSTAGSSNRRLVTFDNTPVRTTNTVSSEGTFTNSNVNFVMKRLFLSKAAAGTTDSAGDLYAMTDVFAIDLSPFSSWSQTFEATTTGSGS